MKKTNCSPRLYNPPAMLLAVCGMAALVSLTPARADQHGVKVKGIVCPASASKPELLAAKEIRRYVYLRTGSLLSISKGGFQRRRRFVLSGRRSKDKSNPGGVLHGR